MKMAHFKFLVPEELDDCDIVHLLESGDIEGISYIAKFIPDEDKGYTFLLTKKNKEA